MVELLGSQAEGQNLVSALVLKLTFVTMNKLLAPVL